MPSVRARSWHTPDQPVAVAGSRYLPPNRPGASLPARRLVPSTMPGVWRQHLSRRGRSRPGLSPSAVGKRATPPRTPAKVAFRATARCGSNVMSSALSAPTFRKLTTTYPPDRCAGCERLLTPNSEAIEGEFPVALRDYLLVIRCRVCRVCLDRPELRDAIGLRNKSLLILSHLCGWYAGALRGAGQSDATVPVHRIVCNRNRGARR